MTLAITIEKRRESEIARVLEMRDRPEGLNGADTRAAKLPQQGTRDWVDHG